MSFGTDEIPETIRMVTLERLDIRTVTLGINLLDCAHPDSKMAAQRVYDKVTRVGEKLVPIADSIGAELGISIVNKRVAVPGDTPAMTLAGIIADQMAIGVINNKTTGVHIIPVIGKKAGEWAEFGGLLGRAPIMSVNSSDCDASARFIARGGRVPCPL